MAYCFNCGNKVADDDVFCEHCGIRLVDETAPPPEENAGKRRQYVGFIYTHLKRLARSLGCSTGDLEKVLEKYAKGVELTGGGKYEILYSRQDSSRYEDYVKEIYKNIGSETKYLFIIGGPEVIPMPCLINLAGANKDVDTDLPYAVMDPKFSEKKYYDGSVLTKEMRLCVGRLPVGKDTTIDDIKSYFAMAKFSQSPYLVTKNNFAQINPLWTLESDLVVENLMKLVCDEQEGPYSHNRMFLTPHVTSSDIYKHTHGFGDFFYYNLHGSGSPNASGYYGEDGRGGYPEGAAPHNFARAIYPNIVVTEACYGAKFIGLEKSRSILLTALYHKTVGFLGSSRVAFGSGLTSMAQRASLGCADLFCRMFIKKIMAGSTLGEAVTYARSNYKPAVSQKRLVVYGVTTLTEFNLFGDPALKVNGESNNNSKSFDDFDLDEPFEPVEFEVKDIYQNGGILSAVRSALDRSRNEIDKIMLDKLYSNYGLNPKNLSSVKEISYGDGTDNTYCYMYKETFGDIEKIDVAVSDSKGEIQRILTSK